MELKDIEHYVHTNFPGNWMNTENKYEMTISKKDLDELIKEMMSNSFPLEGFDISKPLQITKLFTPSIGHIDIIIGEPFKIEKNG